MRECLLILCVLTLLQCSFQEKELNSKISLPYKLIDLKNVNVAACLTGSDKSQCSKMSWEMSFIGAYDKTLEVWNVTNKKVYTTKKDSLLNIAQYEIKPAKNILLNLVKDKQVVMFNEAHHLPHHRITTMSYLEEMHELGFRYLGVEGLKENGDSLMNRKVPTINSGYYIKEPQYSNLLKKAISLGYTVFNYDDGGRGKEREITQAKNIARILQSDENAKILIHAGWGHIREDTTILGGLMAYEFKKETGIDPFTINQTRFNEQSKIEFEHFIYQKLDYFDVPSFLVNKTDQTIYTDYITDVIIFHPRTSKRNNRPNYYNQSDLFTSKTLSYSKFKKEELLILVYDRNDKTPIEERIAIDIAVKEKHLNKVELHLPFSGEFIIYAIDSESKVKDIQKLSIDFNLFKENHSEITIEQQSAFDALNKLQMRADEHNRIYSTFPGIDQPCYPPDSSFTITQSELLIAMKQFVNKHCKKLDKEVRDKLANTAVLAQTKYKVLHCPSNSSSDNYKDGLPYSGIWVMPNVLDSRDIILEW